MNLSNAEGGIRTPTSLRTLRPERSAYTNFTTSASAYTPTNYPQISPKARKFCFSPANPRFLQFKNWKMTLSIQVGSKVRYST